MGKRIELSARVFLSRAYNYIDTCAFQGPMERARDSFVAVAKCQRYSVCMR